jgi:hypothetical protein
VTLVANAPSHVVTIIDPRVDVKLKETKAADMEE